MDPPQAPSPASHQPKNRDFLIGLGVGAIPLAVGLIGIGAAAASSSPGQASGTGLVTFILAGIFLLLGLVMSIGEDSRRMGQGMLVSSAVGLVAACVGCSVVPSLVQPAP